MHERQLEILRAIVDEYVATEEPVGSKALAEVFVLHYQQTKNSKVL